jgi:hypothetical protein
VTDLDDKPPLAELVACWRCLDRMAAAMQPGAPGRQAMIDAQQWITCVMAEHYGTRSWAQLVPDSERYYTSVPDEPMPVGDAFLNRYYTPRLVSRGD